MKLTRRLIALTLTLALGLGLFPSQTLAYLREEEEGGKPTSFTSSSGETVEVDETWESVYPYGAFVFKQTDISLVEGGDTTVLEVLRLGGAAGRVTLQLAFSPSVFLLDDEGSVGYGSAAGYGDVAIQVEDPLPIAQYQPLGQDPDPERAGLGLEQRPYTGEEAQEGDLDLWVDTQADAFQWYVWDGGKWNKITDAVENHLPVAAQDLEDYDFRCVFTQGKTTYATDSYQGVPYQKPAPEVLPEMPDDLDLAPEKTFSDVVMDPENPYASVFFEMTFADGEWVKELRLTAPEDQEAEAEQFFTLSIFDHQGGDLYGDGGNIIVSVTDNDEPLPSTLGFAVTQVTQDKAQGAVQLTVERLGGSQSLVTVEYATADGTAKAGRDYEAASGSLAFYTEMNKQVIEIPLIDDHVPDDSGRTFTVTLSQVKGDYNCTLTSDTAAVTLVNSGEGKGENLATLMALPTLASVQEDQMEDATGRAEVGEVLDFASSQATQGKEVALTQDQLLQANYTLDGQANTYQYGKLVFDSNTYRTDSYWMDEATVAGEANPTYTNWTGDTFQDGVARKVQSDRDKSGSLTIPHMNQLYSRFSGWAEWHPELSGSWRLFWYGMNFAYPYFNASGSQIGRGYTRYEKDGTTYTIYYRPEEGISKDLDITSTNNTLTLGIAEFDGEPSYDDAWGRLTRGRLTRRYFSNSLRLTVHTANDGSNPGEGNVPTAPAGAAALDAGSGVYEYMKPSVTVVPGSGGINGYGQLFVGSKLKVSLKSTDSYSPYTGEALNAAIYLTRKDGSIFTGVPINKDGNDYVVTLLWDGITQNDISNEIFSINVVMTRKQKLTLDLSPSVQRQTDREGNPTAQIDPNKVGEALSLFWQNGGSTITLGCSQVTANAPHFSTDVVEKHVSAQDLAGQDNVPQKTLGEVENLQYINFNRSAQDKIVYNGKLYNGNEKIYLSVADLAAANLNFLYYNEAYVNAESIMTASVGSVGLYWDGNGNGRIDGHYDAATGYFVLDKDASGQELDTFLTFLEEGETLNQSIIAPIQDDQGNWHEYFLKIYYNMIPRNLIAPPGTEGDRAQVLPAFLSSITSDQARGALTEAQKSYRYLYSGKDGQGSYTSDDHLMYGPEATTIQFVDVALGGDRSPAHAEDGEMVWTPDHRGSLLFPFQQPEPIILADTVVGKDFSLTDFSVDDSGAVSISEAGKRELNGYLGSFLDDTTVALCIQQQTRTTDELPGHADEVKPESSALIRRSVLPDGSHLAMGEMDPDGVPGPGVLDAMEDNPFPEFNYNGAGQISPASIDILPVDSFLNVVIGKDSVKFTVSIPLVSWSNTAGLRGPNFDTLNARMKQFNELCDSFESIARNGQVPRSIREILENQRDDKLNTAGSLTSHSLSFALIFMAAISWKYDATINGYYFQNLTAGLIGSGSYKLQHRFTALPIVYIFFKVGLTIAATVNWTWSETVTEDLHPYIPADRPVVLEPGDTYEFACPYRNGVINFNGKIYVEMLDKPRYQEGVPLENGNKGYLRSNGGDQKLRFASGKGVTLPDGQVGYVRIVALEHTQINRLNVLTKEVHEYHFNGFQLGPTLTIELGVGVGIDVLKLELFGKFAGSITWAFGGVNEKTWERDAAMVKQAEFSLALALRLALLFVNFSVDLVGYSWKYTAENGWKGSFRHIGKLNSGGGLRMGFVEDTSASQRLMSPATLLRQELNAYLAGPDVDPAVAQDLTARFALQSAPHFSADWVNAYDTSAPFQVSGYNSGVSAFTLGDGFPLNSAYKVASDGTHNYVLYTLSRAGEVNQADRSMLVLSRLVQTGDAPGLVNPADPDSSIPYLTVDNDATGDLDFDFTVEDGHLIRVVWTGFASPAGSLAGLSIQDALAQVAAQRVVKTASFDLDGSSSAFSAPQVLSDQGLVYLPQTAGEDASLFVEAQPYSAADRNKLIALYTAGLKAQGLDPDSSDDMVATNASFRLAAQVGLWDTTGQQSRLTAVIGDRTIQSVLPLGQAVDSMDMTKIGDAWYLSFLTSEVIPTDGQGNRAEEPDQVENLLTIRRLCLKKLWLEGETLTFGKTYVLEQIYDFDQNNSLQDGMLRGGQRQETTDPSLADLKFLRADLGDSLKGLVKNGQESFLLYEKSGYTWLIREDSLLSAAQGGSWTAIPFFRCVAGEEDQAEVPARTGVVIGADGAGGLAAVYVSTVPNTTNNALYLSTYDKVTGSWGEGVMLAMNHMDVHERATSQGWSQEETEAAYYDQDKGGGMDRFTFSAPKIALGTKAKERPTQEEAHTSSGEEGDHGTTLLVLTQGLWEPLETATDEEDKVYYVPAGETTRGIYAISYGSGQQSIGAGTLSLLNYNFSAGASLLGTAGFTNTGDVGIRGSQDQPITVRLTADGESSQVLREWTITENLAPGQKVSLEFDFTLSDTLSAGTRLGLTVAESDYYKDQGGEPFSASLNNLLTVAQRPELGYENFSVRLSPQTPAGTALLNLDLRPSNRGTADVENAYLQFTYDTGDRTEDGKAVYAPLDLTGHNLTVGEEEPLQLAGANLSQGILPLGRLSQGYSRRVWGTFTAPLSAFRDPDTGSLNLRVELFSDADTQVATDSLGRITALHGEYDSLNNVSEASVNQATFFSLPGKLTLPMGYTLRLPVSYVTTHPTSHRVLVSEYPDQELTAPRNGSSSQFKLMSQQFSQLYYQESGHSNGLGQGTVVLTPMEQGHTYLRIMDLTTNGYTDVPCEITQGSDGLNIFQDTGIFTFQNADGTPFGPGDPAAQSWVMSSQVDSWGADGSAPYRNDLAKGRPGASFSYSSTAESLKLVFNGSVSVSSTFPGFQTVHLTAQGGTGRDMGQAAVVIFGNNSGQMVHTVTVTVDSPAIDSAYCELDRLMEYAHGDSPMTIASDCGPQMFWSHSFPQTQSCLSQTVSQTLSVVGSSGLSQVWVDPSDNCTVGTLRQVDDTFWELPLTILGNGPLTVHAVDLAGNASITSINVDWWPQDQEGDTVQAGDYTAATRSWVQTSLNGGVLTVSLNSDGPQDRTVRVERIDGTGLPVLLSSQGSGSSFAVEEGLYRVTVFQPVSTSDDPSLAYRITRADGAVEEYNAGDVNLWTSRFIRVAAPSAPAPEEEDSDSGSGGGDSGSSGVIAVTVSDSQAKDGSTVRVPVTITAAPGAPESLPTVSVSMDALNADAGSLPLVSIPISNPDSATVAWVKVNGSWELVRDAYVKDGALLVPVAGNCEIAVGKVEKTFPDVSSSAWYTDSVRFVSARGLFNGTGQGFEPDGTMTRSMAAQVLYNLDRQKTPGQELPFFDLASGAWYTDAVSWANSRGVITGYGGAFRPEDPVTRQELVTILYRYALSAGFAPQAGQDLSAWPDAAAIAPWAQDAMAWAVGKGILNGTGDGLLDPTGTATRAQVAKLLTEFVTRVR